MGDTMRPLPLKELFNRSFDELKKKGSIFDIPQELFCLRRPPVSVTIFSNSCGSPIGPAAGPHTQLAQNILSAYLCGARYFELKTVQILDRLEIEKPCIDARDEGYNVEWSSEFTLDKSYDEYLKAWFVLHAIDYAAAYAEAEGGSLPSYRPSFLFNMSIGYDLEGIKSAAMDRYIRRVTDSSREELFASYSKALPEAVAAAEGTSFEDGLREFAKPASPVPPHISTSVTLSTMHGCPPDEIEAICEYLIADKKLDTLVKLNPTLLGYKRVREILDTLGYEYVDLDHDGFEKDLRYEQALPLLRRLSAAAAEHGRFFGVKLTNTLAAVNNGDMLPGEAMYLSGRALYPISIHLAAKIAREFDGELPISFSAGVSAWNVRGLIEAGVKPVTVATDLLKPGGYGRLKNLTELAGESAHAWAERKINVDALEKAAAESLEADYAKKSFRGQKRVAVPGTLPLTDCFVAPCITTCPIAQDVPDYIHLTGKGKYAEAFSVIYDKNPLPFITGYLCDHACQQNCTRLDWEGPVKIREMKRIAAERGYDAFRKEGSLLRRKAQDRGQKAAVIGAGPSGLSAASFLSREGFGVRVFERESGPGGVIRNVLPGFRVPAATIERDVSLLQDLGVEFSFNLETAPPAEELKAAGFSYVLAATGAEKGRSTGLEHAIEGLEFLRKYRRNPNGISIGPVVAIVGAGDTAMDAARAARRCPGVRKVYVLYRRSAAEMPASQEEYDDAVSEGIEFKFLRQPAGWTDNGGLECSVMALGRPDGSGRRRPVNTGQSENLHADTVITAVGQDPDMEALSSIGISGLRGDRENGVYVIGDASTGAATIVKAIASAREAVDDILASCGGRRFSETAAEIEEQIPLRERRDRVYTGASASDDEMVAAESYRCLGCRALCLKCVEVCPNRANTAIAVPGFKDTYQIIHLDAFCNECGNCETFCPWDGSPYRDKFTVFSTREDFDQSSNTGFYVSAGSGVLRTAEGVLEITARTGSDGAKIIEASGGIRVDVKSIIETILREHGYLLGPVAP